MLILFVESGRPLIFRQTRIGKNLNPFTIYKLRTMVNHSTKTNDQVFFNKDQFVTPFGKILRASKVDELLQLLNVVKGDMAFFGPRPLREKLHKYYLDNVSGFDQRYRVCPGILGISQIVDPFDKDRQFGLRCDLYLMRHNSSRLKMIMIFTSCIYILHNLTTLFYKNIRNRWCQMIEQEDLTQSLSHSTLEKKMIYVNKK